MLAGLVAVVVGAVMVAVAIAAVEAWASREGDDPSRVDEVVEAPGDDVFAAPRTDPRPPEVERSFAQDLSPILDIGPCLSAGHGAWLRAWPQLFVGGWILVMLDANGNGSGGGDTAEAAEVGSLQAADPVAELLANPALLVPLFIGAFVCVAALAIVRAWIATGWLRVHRGALVDGTSDFRTLFGGGDRVLAMIGWRILRLCVLAPLGVLALGPGLAALASGSFGSPGQLVDETSFLAFFGLGVLLALPAWLWAGPGLLFGEHFVVLDGDGPLDALRRSWRAARGNRVALIVFYVVAVIVQAAVTLSGLLLLCVGMIVTVPYARAIVDVAWTRAWLLARHGVNASVGWAVP